MSQIESSHFTGALKSLLTETFFSVKGHYLDGGDSLFETLATISAAEASIPVGGNCASLAAQVKHTAYYLEVVAGSVMDINYPKADWGAIWREVTVVDEGEWKVIQEELQMRYDGIITLIETTSGWPTESHIAGAISIVAHSAYHLGEIRQALCILRP